jgi:hypothetical protein
MQLSVYEIAIIGIGGTIIGSLTGAWVGYRLTLQLSAINARREANKNFISIFHRELSDVYPYPIKWPKDIVCFLESKFSALNAATGEFRYHLPSEEWGAFDKAWFSFYNATGREIDNKNCQCYDHYKPSLGVEIINGKMVSHDNTKTYKEDFKRNVDNLLKFAKQK